jgi:predicted nucleotidyltransferase
VFPTIPTQTTTLPFDDLVARLAARDAVDGVVVTGSASTSKLNPTSDYDLLAVLSQIPAPLRLVLTTVDGRLTEVYFATTAAIDRILSIDRPAPGDLDEALHIQWLQAGHV